MPQEAGKSLAFELPTAAGFHIFRATESVLRRYYDHVTSGKVPPKVRSIAIYVRQLRIAKCAEEIILATLEQMAKLHRNPLIHPEVALTTRRSDINVRHCPKCDYGDACRVARVASYDGEPLDGTTFRNSRSNATSTFIRREVAGSLTEALVLFGIVSFALPGSGQPSSASSLPSARPRGHHAK